MRSGKSLIGLIIFLAGLFLLSCKQKDNGSPVFGQWKVASFDFDSTNNMYKEMSAEEKHDMTAIAAGFVFDFKKDNTFIITHRQGVTNRGTFKITDKDEMLMSEEGKDVEAGQILLLDKTTFVLKDTKRGYIFTLKKI